MGWSVGYDSSWGRDIGYGVPATCDFPGCGAEIDRGLSFVCGSDPMGGEYGCGLYFCGIHLWLVAINPTTGLIDRNDGIEYKSVYLCWRCVEEEPPFEPTPDTAEWTRHKMTDPSWAEWRRENKIEFIVG